MVKPIIYIYIWTIYIYIYTHTIHIYIYLKLYIKVLYHIFASFEKINIPFKTVAAFPVGLFYKSPRPSRGGENCVGFGLGVR